MKGVIYEVYIYIYTFIIICIYIYTYVYIYTYGYIYMVYYMIRLSFFIIVHWGSLRYFPAPPKCGGDVSCSRGSVAHRFKQPQITNGINSVSNRDMQGSKWQNMGSFKVRWACWEINLDFTDSSLSDWKFALRLSCQPLKFMDRLDQLTLFPTVASATTEQSFPHHGFCQAGRVCVTSQRCQNGTSTMILLETRDI